jgi:hypothetical protein
MTVAMGTGLGILLQLVLVIKGGSRKLFFSCVAADRQSVLIG